MVEEVPGPECIQILFLSHTIPVHTCRKQFCLNSTHNRKSKIAVRKDLLVSMNSTCCFWPLWAFLDTSLSSTKNKRIIQILEYTSTIISFLYHDENIFTFECVIHVGRATKKGFYCSKRKIRGCVSLLLMEKWSAVRVCRGSQCSDQQHKVQMEASQ